MEGPDLAAVHEGRGGAVGARPTSVGSPRRKKTTGAIRSIHRLFSLPNYEIEYFNGCGVQRQKKLRFHNGAEYLLELVVSINKLHN